MPKDRAIRAALQGKCHKVHYTPIMWIWLAFCLEDSTWMGKLCYNFSAKLSREIRKENPTSETLMPFIKIVTSIRNSTWCQNHDRCRKIILKQMLCAWRKIIKFCVNSEESITQGLSQEEKRLCEISGFCGCVFEDFALAGCHVVKFGKPRIIFGLREP